MFQETLERLRSLFHSEPPPEYALVLSGGGARAAFQVGVLRYLSEAFPEARFRILTGVSAGAINAAHLGSFPGPFRAAGHHLAESWSRLSTDDVFRAESGLRLFWRLVRGTGESARENGNGADREVRGLLDSAPLRALLMRHLRAQPDGTLPGIARNLQRGRLKALALLTTSYTTGQTVSWVQGQDIARWERPYRVSVNTALTVDHVMASASLPLLFSAVPLGEAWYGDGGIRLSAPLAPALHLGAERILIISTRYPRSRAEADAPAVRGYPPAAQIIGILMNAIFLDALDQDAHTVRRLNALLEELPPRKRHGMRPTALLEVRPSVDIGRLAGEYEATIPAALRFITRGLGTDETRSPDWLSMLLFEKPFIARLIEIGYADARRQHDEIEAFLDAER